MTARFLGDVVKWIPNQDRPPQEIQEELLQGQAPRVVEIGTDSDEAIARVLHENSRDSMRMDREWRLRRRNENRESSLGGTVGNT